MFAKTTRSARTWNWEGEAIAPFMRRESVAPHMAKKLRVLVAHNVPRARDGGMSRIMGFIHDEICAAGHAVDYFCADDAPARLNGAMSRFSFPLVVCGHAIRAARNGKPYDLINVHEPSSAAISTLKRFAGSPIVVVTSHGVERRAWELVLEESRLGMRRPSLKTRAIYPLTSLWQSSMGLRAADHIFCLNSEDRDYLSGRMSLSPDGITRIYPAASMVFGEAARERDYARHQRLLFAATWRKNKGVEDLIPAFTALAERHRNLELIVLGAGVPDDAVLDGFPSALRQRVRCGQSANDAETAGWFAGADLFVLPSLFEGTPLTLIEAMASGLPVVTTATCGMKDVIRDGVNGLLVPRRSAEAIVAAVERLINDASLRARLGKAAWEEAKEKYRWERVAVPVREVYERLCGRQP